MDRMSRERPTCPFCSYSVSSATEQNMYFLMHHLELSHPENGNSPFVTAEERRMAGVTRQQGESPNRGSALQSHTPSEDSEEDDVYVDCPAQCGESVTLAELSSHMELHGAEGVAFDEPSSQKSRDVSPYLNGGRSASTGPPIDLNVPPEPGNISGSPSAKKYRPHGSAQDRRKDSYGIRDWKELILGPVSKKTRINHTKARATSARRLGRSELGPHAYEDQMPGWLRKQLERGAPITIANQLAPNGQIIRVENVANETCDIVPVLAQLCEQDPALSKVFLCHPGVKHVVKMVREGGFCGYRNIQMMVSYIQATKFPGHEHFPGKTPSILRLQDLIEDAWDRGFNETGRIETGGIRGTRKYIGTPEAQALFCSLDVGCEASAFNRTEDNPMVYESVLHAVLQYFSAGVTDPSHKVYRTLLPPIYLQHPGHSLTIVGLEIRKSGAANLLVLDPMFKTSPGICRLIGAKFRAKSPENLLKAYRRGHSYLQRYSSFEVLKLTTPAPPLPPPPPSPPGLLRPLMIEARQSRKGVRTHSRNGSTSGSTSGGERVLGS